MARVCSGPCIRGAAQSTTRASYAVCAWVVAALLWLCGTTAGAAELTLAIADLPSFAPVLIAEAQGYFADEGVALRIVHAVNGKRCLKHLLDGEAQFATVADLPLMMASFGTEAFAIVGTFTTTARENRFVGRTDRGIHQPSDLRGKRLGVLMGTSSEYYADSFLLYHGIAPSQVTMVALDAADPVGALARGEVDAAALYNPHGRLAAQRLGGKTVVLPSPRLYTATFNLVSVSAAAGGHDDDIVKLLRAVRRAEALIDQDPARARAVIARALKLPLDLVEAQWGDYDFDLHLGQPLVTTLEAEARWAQRAGLVGAARIPDFLDYIRTAPLQRIYPRAVTLVK